MESTTSDTQQLAVMGYNAELPRNFTAVSMLAMAFAILNSWGVLSASLSLSLTSGGPSAAVWGLVCAGAGNLCLAASLAEFLSAFPTAGGQYHWVSIVAPRRYALFLAWLSGWITVFGWIAVTGSGAVLTSQMIAGILASAADTDQRLGQTHQFLLYLVVTAIAFATNVVMASRLPALNRAALFWSILGFVTIPTTALVLCRIPYATAGFVFEGFINETGWPDSISWLLGFLQAGLALNGYDSVSHCIEEIPNAATTGPKIMIASVALGIFTGFLFIVAILFVSGGPGAIHEITQSAMGPLKAILYTSTGSQAIATCLAMFPLLCLLFGTVSIMTTSSRMVFAFARDGGLPASRVLRHIHKDRAIPLNSLSLTAALTALLGIIFLISTTAFNAISSASVIALSISYALPVAVHLSCGRKKLPPRPFVLPPILGWLMNIIGVMYAILTSLLFLLPPRLPVISSNMNYAGAALFLVLLGCVGSWVSHGRMHYGGPALVRYQLVPGELQDELTTDGQDEHAD